MTKTQMNTAAQALLVEHKASKKLSEAVIALLQEYAESSNKSVDKRERDITIDGVEYHWCNRHEIYEVATNFKKPHDCTLSVVHWNFLGKAVAELTAKLMKDAEDGKDVSTTAKSLREAKELRAGRYDVEANMLQHAEVKDYAYDIAWHADSES